MVLFRNKRVSGDSSQGEGRRTLGKEITGIVLIKLAVILLAGFTIFGARHRVHVGIETMTNQMFGSTVPSSAPNTR